MGLLYLVSESFVRGLAIVCDVWSSKVVEPFPFVEFSLQIDVTFVGEQLVEFLLVGMVGSLDFAVELWRSTFDVRVPDPEVLNVPMELGLELVAVVSPNFSNAEWKLLMMWSMKSMAFACVCFS